MQENDRLELQLFARRGGRNYMMRSEKRPSYNRPEQERRPKRRRKRYGYIILTLLVSILLWPVGLFLIWNRRLRCGVGGKLLWSIATLAVFCGLILALLTVPTGNAEFQRFQDDANDFIETASADLTIAWETFSERAGDAFGNMRTVGYSIGNFSLNKAADGIEGGVELGRDARAWLEGLFPAEDAQAPAADGEDADEDAPAAQSSASPSPLSAPTPSVSIEPPSDEESEAAQLAVAGLALAHAGLDDDGASVAPQLTPYPTPTSRDAAPEASERPEATQAPERSATPEAESAETAEATQEATPSATPEAEASEDTDVPRETPQPAMAAPTPTPRPATLTSEPVSAKAAGEFTVYHTDGGRYYHTDATCSGMRDADAYTLAESVEDGFDPCPDCDAPAAELLEAEDAVWVDEDSVYHISDECPSFSGEARLMAVEDAEAADCVPCAACGANALSSQEDALSEDELLEAAKDVTVYFYDGSRAYHAESSCYGMSGAPERTLYEAIEMDKPPCSRCDPPTLEDME